MGKRKKNNFVPSFGPIFPTTKRRHVPFSSMPLLRRNHRGVESVGSLIITRPLPRRSDLSLTVSPFPREMKAATIPISPLRFQPTCESTRFAPDLGAPFLEKVGSEESALFPQYYQNRHAESTSRIGNWTR